MDAGLLATTDKKKNGQVKSDSQSSPKKLERKSRFSGLSRLFKPWKWKRRKKSDNIQNTANDLERNLSVRATREELIRKGVLKDDLVNSNHVTVANIEVAEDAAADTPTGSGDAALKLVENGVMAADVAMVTHAGDTVDNNTKHNGDVAGPVEVEISNMNELPSLEAAAAAHSMIRPSHIPTSAPPPYNSVHAHIIVPSNSNVTVDITNRHDTTYNAYSHMATVNHDGASDPSHPADTSYNTNIVPQDSFIEPQHPYTAVPASEYDFSKVPRKSALKSRTDPNINSENSPRASPRPVGFMGDAGSSPRTSSGTRFSGVRVLPSVPLSHSLSPRKPVPRPRTTVGFSENKENVPVNVPDPAPSYYSNNNNSGDYDNVQDSDDSSDSDEIHYRDDIDSSSSLAAKVARQDSLARFLSNRPSHRELIDKNIIPSHSEYEKHDQRELIGNKLIRRLSLRPTHEELHQRNILRFQSNEEHKNMMDEKKRYLIRKLSFRPSIEELRERKIIRFNDYIEVSHANDYDRKGDKPWTRLTPHDKATIRQELNEFKEMEMDVHTDSRHLTRFHRP